MALARFITSGLRSSGMNGPLMSTARAALNSATAVRCAAVIFSGGIGGMRSCALARPAGTNDAAASIRIIVLFVAAPIGSLSCPPQRDARTRAAAHGRIYCPGFRGSPSSAGRTAPSRRAHWPAAGTWVHEDAAGRRLVEHSASGRLSGPGIEEMIATMHVPFVDLKAQHRALAPEIETAVRGVFERGDFILGPAVEQFEAEYAALIGTRHAISVGTGLAAIELALRAYGVGPGDEVITAANTFIATVLAIAAVGAKPVLVDMDRDTYTIDPAAIAAAVGPRTRAIVPVHLYGQPVDIDGVMAVAARHNLLVIEDAAQAHGARYGDRRAGSFGHAAA